MYFNRIPLPLKKLYAPDALWLVETNEKDLFLTFDDGPDSETTPDILKILDEYEAKATFFCIGEKVSKQPKTYCEILKRGHTAGNHTNSHLNGWDTPLDDYICDIEKCSALIHSDLFRPPYGKITRKQYHYIRQKNKIIFWTAMTGDFDNKNSGEACLKNAIKNTRKGSIVVFHDNKKAKRNLEYALPRFLEYFKEKNYNFKAISY
ncbi:MAG: polysaccharide deacetylase family protein [Bacteroidales bacterium]|jgi:peptidoglycan/xylan/chitin deacetylase (PgdA/CDA1 family)|nr:polysaccharide deacetylase family protein [Bacteroidales bacterium]MDD4214852.1 polysaccharide deacetylase family protein [Bacteroidales bacterium]